MSGPGRAGVVLALCGLWLPAAASALESIDACQRSLVPEVDVGYERIVQRCPDLLRALDDTQLVRWLPAGWKRAGDNLTAKGLGELGTLLNDELARSTARATPSTQSLPAILRALNVDTPATGWWARFREWLRHALQGAEGGTQSPAWLRNLHLSPSMIAKIVVGTAVLCLLLAVVLVTNELRAAGFLRRRGKAGGRRQSLTESIDVESPAAGLDRVPLIERPAVLLRLAAQRLPASQLTPGAALTARELQQAIGRAESGGDSDIAAVLGRVVEVAELIRYGEVLPPEQTIAAVVERGRAVLGVAA